MPALGRTYTDMRQAIYNNTISTTMTSLPLIRTEGLTGKGSLYIYNNTTGAIYYTLRGCGINTSTTGYWGSGTTTATVATGVSTCITEATVSALGYSFNYITVEYQNTATGAGSGIIQLSVW